MIDTIQTLNQDSISNGPKKKVYGKKGDKVKVMYDYGTLIVEHTVTGEIFSITKDKLMIQ